MNIENDGFTEAIVKYPGVFVIDAHQQGNGYFFPPNEDAVHHEVSQFAIDFIQHDIGPMLQRMFNDQSVATTNYNVYDLFAPIYGDTVPALLDGAAGMTYEKGSSEVYGKQVYDHYLAMDATQNITSDNKVQVLDGWVRQWGEARQQGAECQLQMNKLVSPLHTQIFDQPDTDGLRVLLPARPEHRRHGAADRRADVGRRARVQARHARSTPPACTRSASPTRRSGPDAARRHDLRADGAGPEALDPGHPRRGSVPAVPVQLRRRAVVVPAHARHRRQRLPDAAVPARRLR